MIGTIVLDVDGVILLGSEPVAGAGETLDALRIDGFRLIVATNNATRTPQQFVEKLARMGVTIYADEVLTSALATADYLAGIAPPGTRVFVIGEDGLRTALRDAGFDLVKDVDDVSE